MKGYFQKGIICWFHLNGPLSDLSRKLLWQSRRDLRKTVGLAIRRIE